jgi:hypothetical protein
VDQTDRVHRPPRSSHLRDRHLIVASNKPFGKAHLWLAAYFEARCRTNQRPLFRSRRPHLSAAGGLATSPWLFPSVRPGRHRQPQEIMERLGRLGIDLLGARNTALQSLVVAAPAPLVAELLGYSYNTVQRHAEIAAQPWARYVTKTVTPLSCRPMMSPN